MRKYTPIIILLVILTACTTEEIRPREYPRIRTRSISNVTNDHAVFHGEITYYNGQPIVDHGFIVSSASFNTVLSLGAKTSKGKFKIPIEQRWTSKITYYVRAYAKTSEFTVYGEILELVRE